MTLFWCGANLGGATIARAPTTGGVEPSDRNVIDAVTGPSETSSYQPALPQKLPMMFPAGDPDVPCPPSTRRWFRSSERISPSGTATAASPANRISPPSRTSRWSGPVSVRGPGSIVRSAADSLLPRSGCAALALTRCTVQEISASSSVISSNEPSSW
jgi:hypothetical protein